MPRDNFINQPQFFYSLALIGIILFGFNLILITGVDVRGTVSQIGIVDKILGTTHSPTISHGADPILDSDQEAFEELDNHPIVKLTNEYLAKFEKYKAEQSKTFAEVIIKYRSQYGRNPPPGFDKWYKFAKKKNVVNIDDFAQIHDDLRPFWGIEPHVIRQSIKNVKEDYKSKTAVVHIRDKGVSLTTRGSSWRLAELEKLIRTFAQDLPDLDIVVNNMEEPRVNVGWDELQELLKHEEELRIIQPAAANKFTNINWEALNITESDLGFTSHAGEPYINLARLSCPPNSYARSDSISVEQAEDSYKQPLGSLIHNFNRSSDICTVGNQLSEAHGFMISSPDVLATKQLLPIFSESKVNINNDILYPSMKYYSSSKQYSYDRSKDVEWSEKLSQMFWRGITAGGDQSKKNWMKLHRHRFVAMTNATVLSDSRHHILSAFDEDNASGDYIGSEFRPASYAKIYTDVGFSQLLNCNPDLECNWLKELIATKPGIELKEMFANRFLADIDGSTLSGRWYAFLKSRSLGIKATIFKEWHDSRLFEWVHFVPMDNRFDDLYTILTYFIGLSTTEEGHENAYVPRHEIEAQKIADRSREWANAVLRKEDMEVYMFRLMLEYARILDDNRDSIGYPGDGSEIKD